MSNLSTFFDLNKSAPTHPIVRAWEPLIANQPGQIQCEIQRQREGFGFQPAKIYLHVQRSIAETIQTEEASWDETLNTYLIEHGVKAANEENEALRFHLVLREALQKVETRYGEGYFNAVLLEVIADGFDNPQIQNILKKLRPGSPHKGRAYKDAVIMVEGTIRESARLLWQKLEYPRETAEKILSNALGRYLDERFSISPGELLGLQG
jgi:hypothetical protein